MKRITFCCLFLFHFCSGQGVKFIIPIAGEMGKDFYISNYIDHDTTTGVRDVFCGGKSYNGHRGTDFSIGGFKKMDIGVYAVAAADGRVIKVKDGAYDRNKQKKGGGLGNYIVIMHDNEISTYYGHMMKNSFLVSVGDSVKAGQAIGRVGSSGFSSGPHLHFEVHKADSIVEPFAGPYRKRKFSYWESQPEYDTALFVINSGFIPYVPQLDTLKEGYLVTDTFSIRRDTTVCFWALVHGLNRGDAVHVEWSRKKKVTSYQHTYAWENDSNIGYTWTWIKMPWNKGNWTLKFFVNNKFLLSRDFFVQ